MRVRVVDDELEMVTRPPDLDTGRREPSRPAKPYQKRGISMRKPISYGKGIV